MSRFPYTAIDLFAGCGGMSIGLENAGFRIIHANEINEDAASTYKRNFPSVDLEVRDVRRIDARRLRRKLGNPHVDILAAGPPCQGFSTAGQRKPRDPRNSLYSEVIRFTRVFRPRIVVIENVVGMLTLRRGRVVRKIISELGKLGYRAHYRVLLASEYGVPQARKRVFIIGTSIDVPEGELFPKPNARSVSAAQAISDLSFLGTNEQCEKYMLPARSNYQKVMRAETVALYNHESPNHSRRIRKRFRRIPPGENGKNVLKRVKTRKRTYYKIDPNKPSRTLTSIPEDLIHYRRNRILTVREMARLQSIPDHFEFLGPRTTGGDTRKKACPQYTQVANAVPSLVATEVYDNLSEILDRFY